MKRLLLIFLLFTSTFLQFSFEAAGQFPLPLRTKTISAYDADAQAFFNALEADAAPVTLTSAQKGYVNTLVLAFKTAGVWTKMRAIYPMIGGTTASHKYNLKDPRDLDAAYRLLFTGTWTHSSTGADPNGTDATAETYFNVSVNGTANSFAFGVYSTENIGSSPHDMGTGANGTALILKHAANANCYADLYTSTDARINLVVSTSAGFFINSRTTSTAHNLYINGSSVGSNTNAAGTPPNATVKIAGSSGFSIRATALNFISDGLSSTEAADTNTAVEAFQDSQSRGVQ